MPIVECRIEGCDNAVFIKKHGLCPKHYHRWRRHGDPLFVTYERNDDPDRWQQLWEVQPNGCWLWTGRLDRQGYGIWQWTEDGQRRSSGAHRFVYQMLREILDSERHLDHRCHTEDSTCPGGPDDLHRRCVNPDHMDVVTHAQNVARGRAGRHNAIKTHCKNGHEFTPENTYDNHGGRGCVACRRESHQKAMRRIRGTAPNAVNNAAKTHCKNGHELSGDNLYVIPSTGGRQCKTCSRERLREFKRAKRAGAEVGVPNAAKTHCRHGHEYTPDNTRIDARGGRICRACDRERARLATQE